VRDQAQLTMRGGQINANQSQGVLVEQQARFTLDGGTIVGAAGASCRAAQVSSWRIRPRRR
jgi:hypothetical protein